MRPLRRRPNRRTSRCRGRGPRSPLVTVAPAALAGEPGPRPSGDGPGPPVPRRQVDLVASRTGIMVGRTARRSPRTVPALMPWSDVSSVRVTDPAALPDGSIGQGARDRTGRRRAGSDGADPGPVRAARRRCRPVPGRRLGDRRRRGRPVAAPTRQLRPARRCPGRGGCRGLGRQPPDGRPRCGAPEGDPSTAGPADGSGRSPSGCWPWCSWPAAAGPSSPPPAGRRGPAHRRTSTLRTSGNGAAGFRRPRHRQSARGHLDPGAGAAVAGRLGSAPVPRDLRLRPVLDVAPVGRVRRQGPDHPGVLQRGRQRRRHARRERAGMERLREPGPGRTWSTGPMPPATGSCSPSPASARARSMPSPRTPTRRPRCRRR